MQTAIVQDVEADTRTERDNAIEDVVAEEVNMEQAFGEEEQEPAEEQPPY